MKQVYLIAKIATLSIVLSMLNCCTKLNLDQATDETEFGTSLAIPLGSVHANVIDVINIVDTTNIKADATNQMLYVFFEEEPRYITFKFDKFSAGIENNTDIKLSETNGLQDVFNANPLLTNIPLANQDYLFSQKNSYSFGLNIDNPGEKRVDVDSLTATSATLSVEMKTEGITINETNYLDVEILFPQLHDNAKNHIKVRMTSAAMSFTKEMQSFTIGFDDEDNTTEMVCSFTYHSTEGTSITRDAKISCKSQFTIVNTDVVYGTFWQTSPVSTDKISADLNVALLKNENLLNSRILFHNPEIAFKIKSNNGLPVKAKVDSVFAMTQNGEKYFADFGGKTYTTIDFGRADKAGEFVEKEIKFNRENGHTNKLFEKIPQQINYKWEVFMAKEDDDAREQFLINPSSFWLECYARVPLSVDPTSYFVYKDTIDLDLTSEDGKSIFETINVDAMNLYLDVDNSIPTNLTIAFSLVDENDEELIKVDNISIRSPKVDDEGLSTGSEKSTAIVELGNKTPLVFNVKRAIFDIRITTPDEFSRTSIKSTDKVDIKLSAFAKAQMTNLFNK